MGGFEEVRTCVPLHTGQLPASLAWVSKDGDLRFSSLDSQPRILWRSLGASPPPVFFSPDDLHEGNRPTHFDLLKSIGSPFLKRKCTSFCESFYFWGFKFYLSTLFLPCFTYFILGFPV